MATTDAYTGIYGDAAPDGANSHAPPPFSGPTAYDEVYPPKPYPNMTPGPILSTSYKTLPSATNGEGSPWDAGVARLGEAVGRVGSEAYQTYKDTPDLLTPQARQAVSDSGWFGRNIVGPAVDIGSTAVKDVSAGGAGAMAALSEILSGGNPQGARDVHAALQIAPVAAAGVPSAAPFVPKEPNLTGDLTSTQMQWTPKTLVGPTSPAYPPEALPTKTPADVLKIYKGQIGSAEQSGAQLTPQFTNDWVGTLDQYRKQTPAGQATGGPNSVADLVDNLSKSANAPLDSVQSIQEVDQNIQSAINKEYGPNGLSPEGVQMRQILHDFRDRYGNIPDDQITGNRQGVDDLRTSTGTYAAYSRMRELQGVVDSTEGNPNRATLIASRVNGFLNDDANTRGWQPEEIAQARQAANSGFMQEWMRAEGSRLVGIGAAVALPGVGKLLGVPAQVGLSYAVRNAAETARMAQVQKALGVLGQRVQQPGTVPPQPPPFMPSQAAVTGARYAPLVGLLGQPQQPAENIFPPAF